MTWDDITKPYHPLPRWAHWPKPFNVIKNINVLACNNDTWMAEVEFYAKFFGEIFFHIFVPTPTELTRKSFFGRYRCGLALKMGKFDPMSDVWGKGTTRVLAQVFEPFTKPIFYWWAADSALFAMAAWTSLIYAQAACDQDDSDVLMADGFASVATATTNGSIPFWTVLHDTFNRCNDNSGFIEAEPGDSAVYFHGYVQNLRSHTVTFGWWLSGTDLDEANQVVMQVPSGATMPIRLTGTPVPGAETYQPRFNNQLGEWEGLGFIRYTGTRFGLNAGHRLPPPDDYGTTGLPLIKKMPCM